MRLLPLFLLLFSCSFLLAQNWPTQGGNPGRNGQSRLTGPDSARVKWVRTDYAFASWGGATYTEGDKFATNRIQVGVSSELVVGDVNTGEQLFNFKPHPNSVMLALGICKNRLYAVDYRTQSGDTLYAIDLTTFEVLWKTPPICWNGFTSSLVFACNGDPIINGNVPAQSVMRLDRQTGEILWTNDHFVSINGNNGTCMVGNRIYTWEGSLFTPKKVRVLDAETGDLLFTSDELPGDGDQELRLTAGPDSTVYACRDGGLLYALKDTGDGFFTKWTYSFNQTQPGTYSNFGINFDGSVYITDGNDLLRLDGATGAVTGTAPGVSTGYAALIAIGADSTVYLATSGLAASGKYLAFSAGLDTLRWQLTVPYNYYSAPVLARHGILLTSGNGNAMRAYQTPRPLAPVADIQASATVVPLGGQVQFADRSSYEPTAFTWHFPGGQPSTATGPVPPPVQYDAPGIYDVRLEVANALGADTMVRECFIEVLAVSGTAAPAPAAGLLIYPNPAVGHAAIVLPEGPGLLGVHDAWGRPLRLEYRAGGEALELDLAGWSAGWYQVVYRTGKGVFTGILLKK
jgi:outer membrane protein assembly factor BamB